MTVIVVSFAMLLLVSHGATAGSVVISAPEPVSLSLLAVGAGGLALVRHIRRK
jgi:hypothetical protein